MVIKHKLITVEEFEAFIALPENDERRFELINGEIVEKVPTEEHGVITTNIVGFIWNFNREHNLGRIAVEARHQMPKDKHNSRLPDISFTSSERLLPLTKKGAVPQMPDLAVEVQSPDDSDKKMSDTADYYLANGVRMVWLIYPEKRIVEVLTPNDRQLLTGDDTLDGGEVLPGFKLPVGDIFPK